MGFFNELLSVAAPIVGSAFGPVGTTVGQVVSAMAAPKPKVPIQTDYGMSTAAYMPSAQPPVASYPSYPSSGGMVQTAGTVPALARAAVGGARYVYQLARNALALGKSGVFAVERGAAVIASSKLGRILSGRQAKRLATQFGIEAAATAIGISVGELLFALARNDVATKRRRRGWSARDSHRLTRLVRRGCAITHQIEKAVAMGKTRRKRAC